MAGKEKRKEKNIKGLTLLAAPAEIHPEAVLVEEQPKVVPEENFYRIKLLDLKAEDLENIDPLGSGNGGIVWKVKHKSGMLMARKVIHLEIKPKVREQIIRELKILHECDSPQIVSFYGSFISDMEINVLMEYMDVGSLDKVLKRVGRFTEDVSRIICHSVLLGLVYLRDKYRVIHRDVKPSNILVNSQGEVKLCDFGVSGELTNSLANTFVGTRSYMAPERLLGNKYAIESDIWSLGLTIIEVATGRFPIPVDLQSPLVPIHAAVIPPPEAKKEPTMAIFELLAHIVEGPAPRLPEGVGFSDTFQDFIVKCCEKDVPKRCNLNGLMAHAWILDVLQHPVDMPAWAHSTIPASD